MGDSRRFNVFASLISKNFPPSKYKSIADIAGGKGYLQVALREKGFRQVTTFDKRRGDKRVRGINFRYQFFNPEIKNKFDLLVGMHPDEATDVIIAEAGRRRVPFAICPCCVKPFACAFWGKHKYHDWIAHLKRLAQKFRFEIMEILLPISGRNLVLIGKPMEV